MNINFLKCFLIIAFANLNAQFDITGRVRDSIGNDIEFANVILVGESIDSTNNQKMTRGAVTDVQGRFKLANVSIGEYLLNISFIGYGDSQHVVKLNGDMDLGNLILNELATDLKEVVVAGRRPMVERKVDRLIFNVDEMPALQGLDLTEALDNTPMVEVKNSGLSITGKSEVAIMLNGRLIRISGGDLINYLKAFRTDNIDKIEIITAPPAKYDAQGNSGLINIITKKNPADGWSGNLTGSYTLRTYHSYSLIGVLNYSQEKLSVSSRIQPYYASYRAVENYDIINDPSIFKIDKRKDFNDGVMASVNLNYKINEKTDVGFLYDIIMGNSNLDIFSVSDYESHSILDSTLITNSKHRKSFDYHTANLYYDIKLDTNGRKLSFNSNLLSNIADNPVDFKTENRTEERVYNVRNTSNTNYSIFSGQGDLYLPFKKGLILETGLKFTNLSNKSDVQYLNNLDNEYIPDPTRSNIFRYSEQNYATYISGSRDFGESWSFKAGLRYEYTDIIGESPSNQQNVSIHYGNLFPSLYCTYIIKEGSSISINYAKRIGRPSFGQLNAFRWYSNPYSYSTGNPLLQPSINNNIELTYSPSSNSWITLYFQNESDGYGSVTQVDGATTISTYLNYLTERNYGANLYYNYKKANWLNSTFFFDFKYANANSTLPQFIGQQGFALSYRVNNTVFLNQNKTWRLLVNYNHSLPHKSGNVRWSNSANFTIGVNSSFLENKIQASLVAYDIFRQSISKGSIFLNDSYQYFNNYYDGRKVTLNVTYNFGNSKVKTINKSKKFDAKQRAF